MLTNKQILRCNWSGDEPLITAPNGDLLAFARSVESVYVDEVSRLRDTQRVLVEALREVSEWFALTKPPLDQWEDLAEEFHKETGFLRPGKSYPMGYGLDEEREAERDAKWKEWAEKRRADMTARIRAALASVEQPQPSKTPFRLDPTPVYDQHYAATQSEVEQPVHSVKGPDHG